MQATSPNPFLSYLRSNQSLSLAGNVIFAGLNMLTVTLLFRTLPTAEIGYWVFFLTVYGLADALRTGFLSTAFIRSYSGAAPARANEVVGSAWVIALLTTALLALLGSLSGLIPLPNATTTGTLLAIRWVGPALVLSLPAFMASGVLQAELRFGKILLLRLLSQGLFVISIIGLILSEQIQVDYVLYCYLASSLITSLVVLLAGWTRLHGLRFQTRACVTELAHFGKYSVGSYVGSSLLRSSDTFIINFTLGPSMLAVYNLAQRFSELIELPLRSFLATAIPALSAAFNKQNMSEVGRLLRKNAGLLTWLIIPIVLIAAIFADIPIRLVGGAKYLDTPAVNLLRIIILLAVFYPIDRFIGVTLDVINQPRINLQKVFLMLAVNVAGDLIGIYVFHNIYGVAVASLPTVLIGFYYGYHQLKRFLPITIKGILSLNQFSMTPFSVPTWLQPHLFTNRDFTDLRGSEIAALAAQLQRCKAENPDVSVVIPAWNEANAIHRTLSSLAANNTSLKVEIIVINNNSTDSLQDVLDLLGVTNYLEPKQGIAYARQLGLKKAKGKYHLCADADTFYPPDWITLMTQPMLESSEIAGVYGRYAFIPEVGKKRYNFWLYEQLIGVLVLIRRRRQEFVNVLGFNMGFVTELGLVNGGFKTTQVRVFNNEENIEESEDGVMALHLLTQGKLKLVTDPKSLVFTSPRKVLRDGSIFKAFLNRFKLHASRLKEYV